MQPSLCYNCMLHCRSFVYRKKGLKLHGENSESSATSHLVCDPARAFYFQWHILNQCNLRCQHCYQTDYGTDTLIPDDLLIIARMIVDALKQWHYTGRVSLTGGEPLLIPDTVLTLLDFLDKSPFIEWLGILTNGTCLDIGLSRQLSKYNKLREVQVSLDGSTSDVHNRIRGEGNFERSIRGIKVLQQAGIKTSIMFTLTKENVDSASSIIDLAFELGVNAITIERVTPTTKGCSNNSLISPDHLRSIYQEVARKKHHLRFSSLQIRTSRPLWCLVDPGLGGYCPAGFNCLAILPDGTVLPCRRLEIPIGNILKDGLYNIWYTSSVLWRLRDKKKLAKGCNGCQWLGQCGGCRAIAYATTGDFMATDPQCWNNDSIQTRRTI